MNVEILQWDLVHTITITQKKIVIESALEMSVGQPRR
jgi:hypothetical protein